MKENPQLYEELNTIWNNPVKRRRALQLLGAGTAGIVGASIIAACGDDNTNKRNNEPPAKSTVTTNIGASRQLTPYFLGYNNVPIHSPAYKNDDVINAIKQFNPGVLRYPGGTVANYWDWQKGWFLSGAPKGFSSSSPTITRLSDLQIAVQATNAKPVYVVNMLTSDLNTQLAMLHAAKDMGLPMDFVELGNEFYLNSGVDKLNGDKFPSASDYAKMATEWAKAIHSEFQGVKIGAVGAPPATSQIGDQRKARWNDDLLQNLQGVDAITFHPYVSIKENLVKANDATGSSARLEDATASKWQLFENQIKQLPGGMRVWITEYNLVDSDDQVFRTWIHGVYAAKMTLDYLDSDKTDFVCFYDMIGKTGNEVVYFSKQNDGPLEQYALTAAGYTMRMLGDAMHGMTGAKPLSFTTASGTPQAMSGWIFTNGSQNQAYIANAGPDSISWDVHQAFSQGNAQYKQYSSSNPIQTITDSGALTSKDGNVGDKLDIPAYSVTQVKTTS